MAIVSIWKSLIQSLFLIIKVITDHSSSKFSFYLSAVTLVAGKMACLAQAGQVITDVSSEHDIALFKQIMPADDSTMGSDHDSLSG